ncbi:MAG: YHS domain-containing protein [Cellulosilyticaceae bacterium]
MADIFLNVILAFMLISLFNLIRYMMKIRKVIKINKDNPNIQGISIVNGEVKVIEKEQSSANIIQAELVTDPTCGKQMDKKDAYRIFKDGEEYFFCSWECREKFLENAK